MTLRKIVKRTETGMQQDASALGSRLTFLSGLAMVVFGAGLVTIAPTMTTDVSSYVSPLAAMAEPPAAAADMAVEEPLTQSEPNTRVEPVATTSEAIDPADLEISADITVVDDRVRFGLVVKNNGPGVEPGPVTVLNTTPPGLIYTAFSGKNWACEPSAQDATTECLLDGPLKPGETAELILLATASDDNGSYFNSASVIGKAEVDPDLSNNTAVANLQSAAFSPAETDDKTPAQPDKSKADDSKSSATKPQKQLPKTGSSLTDLLLAAGLALATAGGFLVLAGSRQASSNLRLRLLTVRN